jgi:hypothetical protein
MMPDLYRNDLPAPVYVEKPLQVEWAAPTDWRPPSERGGVDEPTQVQKIGLRFEQKVSEHIKKQFPHSYDLQKPIQYRAHGDEFDSYCIPDALIYNQYRKTCLVVEIKWRHNLAAYNQLRCRYQPIVRRLMYKHSFVKRVKVVEVCRHYQHDLCVPEDPNFVSGLLQVIDSTHDHYNVWVWND